MATHCSILAWRIPWTKEPGELQSMGCKELDMLTISKGAKQELREGTRTERGKENESVPKKAIA